MTLSSVLKSIQTLFDEDPLQNEPGFEKHGKVRKRSVSEEKYADYAEQVTHANIRISLIMQLKLQRVPLVCKPFLPLMRRIFLRNFEELVSLVTNKLQKVSPPPMYSRPVLFPFFD